jgi:predicted ATPase/DNA-binding CsgD family transcriptional regulator
LEMVRSDLDTRMPRGVYNALRSTRYSWSAPMPDATRPSDDTAAEDRGHVIEFPAGRDSRPTPQNNLPLQLTSFVGREKEIADLEKLLTTQARLLTLTGPGGSGKTRLALAVSSGLARHFEDGVWWVELAPISDSDLVPQAVAQALMIREEPGRSLTETLARDLAPTRLLLVMDNCEHLISSCARLANVVLSACPEVRILATSREALAVEGEMGWPVQPLSAPEAGNLGAGELEHYEAVRLFVERARYRKPDFVLDDRNAAPVAEICGRLEGIPLAIELAAARIGTLAASQISNRLERSLKLLTSADRSAPERQRTLRAALDWSYELLEADERELFGRLSVFAGGFTLEAAEAVGAGGRIEEIEVLDILTLLVDKSLVLVVGHDGEARYRLLEPVSQYAWEKLREYGEESQARMRHAEYYLALAEEAEPGLSGAHQGKWLERLEAEHDNFRAALGFSLEGGDGGLGLRLAGVLGGFWYKRGYLREGRWWLEREISAGGTSSAMERATALDQAGWMALYQGDLEPSVEFLRESLRLFKGLEDEPGIAASLAKLGHAVLHQDDRDYLAALCQEAEALRATFTDRPAIGELLVFLGMVELYEGDVERAVSLLEESLDLFRALGNAPLAGGPENEKDIELSTAIELVAGQAQEYLWLSALEAGDLDGATSLIEEELRPLRDLGNKPKISYCLLGLAAIAALRGRPDHAARLWVAAEALRKEIGLALVLWDHAVTDYEALLAGTRSQLGEAGWERAQNEAQDMALEHVIDYALKGDQGSFEEDPSASPVPLPASLSAREVDVLKLVAQGLTNAQIAKQLFISPNTVNRHLNSVYRKLDVSSRAAATRFASEHDLV